MDIGYTEAVAERRYRTDDVGGRREPFILRVPERLLAKMRAAAEAETIARGAEETVTGMVIVALEDHYADYEKDYGTLPPPKPKKPKTKSAAAMKEYEAAVKRQREAMEKYAAELAKKLAAEKH